MWTTLAHRVFVRELHALDDRERGRVEEALRRLRAALERSTLDDVRPDLVPLEGCRVPRSYRLRVGRLRVTLTLAPDERAILLTAIARRDDDLYRRLVTVHERRLRDV